MYSFHGLSHSEPKLNRPKEHRTPSESSSTHHALLKEYMNEVTQDVFLIYISHDIMRCSRHICRIQNEGPHLFKKKNVVLVI